MIKFIIKFFRSALGIKTRCFYTDKGHDYDIKKLLDPILYCSKCGKILWEKRKNNDK